MDSLTGQTIFLTGGNGFLGQPLAAALKERGARVLAPTRADCDVLNPLDVDRFAAKAEIIVHLAAYVGGIGFNRIHPADMWYQNLQMGINILEATRKFKVKKTLIAGTICSYPKFTPIPFKEHDIWNGYPEETNAPYGLAKKMLMEGSYRYHEQYGLNIICLVPVNLYGPRDNFHLEYAHVIPALIRKIHAAYLNDEPTVRLWGTGNATREFLYVDDCVDGFVHGLERCNSPEPINIGAGFEISIRELANKLCALIGYQGDIIWDDRKPDGQPRRSLDVSLADKLLGFRARTSFDEGLKKTIAWWKENYQTWHRI